ncbi:MAG: class I SAM-dependent methyltransferase [Myxococcales bacterium]
MKRSLLFVVAALAACQKPSSPSLGTLQPNGSAPAAATAAAPPVHAPAHPPIDCPLRKQGIVTEGMKPFEQTEKYIEFLERPDRAAWQKPDEVVQALGLKGDETVADVGAGLGYFTFRFAQALPLGKVVAVDVEPQMLRHVHHKSMRVGARNIEVRAARPDDPSVPEKVDVVFVCDVLHHVQNREAWAVKLASEVGSGTRLIVLEFKEGELPEGPPAAMKLPKKAIVGLLTGAGFELVSEKPDLLPYQTYLEFRRR